MTRICFWVKSLGSAGGSDLYEPIGALLTLRLLESTSCIKALDVVVCCAETAGAPTDAEAIEFGKQPKWKYRKGSPESEMTFLSTVVNSANAHALEFNLVLANRAIEEFLEVVNGFLPTMRSRLGPVDSDFASQMSSILAGFRFSSQDEARSLADRARRLPDEPIPIDTTGCHPNAVKQLVDEFFWSEGHEASPHGNDYGLDVWNEYRSREIVAGRDGLRFLDEMIEEYGVANDPVYRFLLTQAVAFAELKVYGRLGKKLRLRFLEDFESVMQVQGGQEEWYQLIAKSADLIRSLDSD